MKVKSESEVAHLCPTLSNPMDGSPPGSSVHGIFQARVLEWGAIDFSSGSLVLQKEKNKELSLEDRTCFLYKGFVHCLVFLPPLFLRLENFY